MKLLESIIKIHYSYVIPILCLECNLLKTNAAFAGIDAYNVCALVWTHSIYMCNQVCIQTLNAPASFMHYL